MKILLFARYGRLGASSRLRSFQYVPYLEKQGINVTVNILLDDEYIKDLYAHRKTRKWAIITAYFKRMVLLFKVRNYDLIWIEKELFPWLPAWVEGVLHFFKVPYIVDYDDPIFHNYDLHKSLVIRIFLGKKIDRVMKNSKLVTTGSEYILMRAKKAGAKWVEKLPTVVDINKYSTIDRSNKSVFTIGWIGTPGTVRYIDVINNVLQKIGRKKNVQLKLIGSGNIQINNINLKICNWSESTEVENIQSFDVGIMPLPDEPQERGKCGYKLIQCMACGKPVIASPVGENVTIVSHGLDGFLASNDKEWEESILFYLENKAEKIKHGNIARKKIESGYSLQINAPRLLAFMYKILND